MTDSGVYKSLLQKCSRQEKSLAVLIDPDKSDPQILSDVIGVSEKAKVDFWLVGSSLLLNDSFDSCISFLKKHSAIPVVLFPGNRFQICKKADALLLLSVISGRNPELLIGQHVLAAADLKRSGLEIIPTGYMLIDGGNFTSVNYVSQTLPIPADKPDIAASTAMAGEMLGMKLIYLEAGSGAKKPVSTDMISVVRDSVKVPLIVGGGIRDAEIAAENCKAGADVIVIGNGFEEDRLLITEMASAVHEAGKTLHSV